MNNRLDNRNKLFSGTGSFWLKNMEETTEVPFMRALSRLTVATKTQGLFEESVRWLAGERETMAQNLLWSFSDKDIVTFNADLNSRIITKAKDVNDDLFISVARPPSSNYSLWYPLYLQMDPENAQAVITELGDFILWPTIFDSEGDAALSLPQKKVAYAIPVPHGYTPIAIATETRELVMGINFTARDGFLVFYEPPIELFPKRNFVVRSAWKTMNHPHDYVWGVENV